MKSFLLYITLHLGGAVFTTDAHHLNHHPLPGHAISSVLGEIYWLKLFFYGLTAFSAWHLIHTYKKFRAKKINYEKLILFSQRDALLGTYGLASIYLCQKRT